MASKKRRRSEPAPGWAWMLFGLSIGLAVALVVYLKTGGQYLPNPAGPVAAQVEAPAAGTAARSQPRPEPADLPEEAPSQVPDDETGGTELSFYTDLGESEVVVREGEFDFASLSDPPQAVMIQAGSFPAIQRADLRRSELALIGIESAIDPAVVGGVTYYRVNVGPLSERGEINRILRRLREKGIENFLRAVTD